MTFKVKRILDKPMRRTGSESLWTACGPRGISKEEVKFDLWLRDIPPNDA